MSKEEPIVYRILRPIAAYPFKLIMRPKLIGTENIPKDGACVLAGNHTKPWDCFMLFLATRRCLHFLAKKEIFKGPMKHVFSAAGIIPVDRSRKNPKALSDAIDYLKNGGIVTIFPEGTTNKTDAPLLPFKMGAVKMANDAGVPIVPFVIKGAYTLRGTRPEMHFYQPITIQGDDLAADNEDFRNFILEKVTR